MKAYVLETNKRIEPLDDHPGDCLIANRKLADLQAAALQQLGLRRVAGSADSVGNDPEEHIVFDDSLYFTPELLKEFIGRSRALRAPTICALKPGLSSLRTIVATQDVRIYPERVEYPLTYSPGSARGASCRPLVIEPDQASEGIPLPDHLLGCHGYRVPLTERVLVSIDHWVNLWAASMATLLAEGARLKKERKTKLLSLVLKARSANRWRILHQANKIGAHCDIHPTAYIEGSTVGEGVQIGAGAVVRESILGDGAYIADSATVVFSVVGDGSAVNTGAAVSYSVLYPGAFVNSRFLNASLLGRNTFLAEGATLTDFRFDHRGVTVIKEGRVVDTESTFVGCCLGHDAYVGSGCIFAPGREIPGGSHTIADASRIIRSPQALPHTS